MVEHRPAGVAVGAWNRRTEMTNKNISAIHESMQNGQRRQMVEQIDEYGSEFWEAYRRYLNEEFIEHLAYYYFSSVTISYFILKAR